MRIGYDSVNPVGCPPNGDVYMGYTDGNYPSFDGMRRRFPGKVYVGITVHANGDGHMCDVEAFDLTPAEGAAWVKMRRALGHPFAAIYCSGSNVPVCVAQLQRLGVKPPWYFSYAHTDGNPAFEPMPGGVIVLSKQYLQNIPYNGSSYDKSSVVDYWPGVDPAPKPPTPLPPVPPEEIDMPNPVAIYSVDQSTVPTGTAWPGEFVHYQYSGAFIHLEPTVHGTNNVAAVCAANGLDPDDDMHTITYDQYLAFTGSA